MDVSNITILVFPLVANIFQSGVKLNEQNCNPFIKFSNYSLYSILVVVLSYMTIVGVDNVIFKGITMGGIQFMACFVAIIAVLLLIHYVVVDQVRSVWWRSILSLFLLLISLAISVIIIFYEYTLK